MKEYVPSYYGKFQCVAEKCRHNCCIGWEIDVDEETRGLYRAVSGAFGERLRKNIAETDGTAHFVLTDGERCPFLNDRNRCDIIETLGDGALCQICDDHPRFRNFFSARVETGLGMACEAAAELILTDTEPFALTENFDDGGAETLSAGESGFLALRDRVFAVLRDGALPLRERVGKMLDLCGAEQPRWETAKEAGRFLGLERLDEAWTELLTDLRDNADEKGDLPREFEKSLENAAVYFVFRHLADGFAADDLAGAARLTARSVYLLCDLCARKQAQTGRLTVADVADIARMYSAEIEYSEDNTAALKEE